VFDGRLWYAGSNEALWASDGTAEGTAQVHAAKPQLFAVFADKLYFRTMQAELWWSDGTAAGTEVIDSLSEWPHWITPRSLLAASYGLVIDTDMQEGQPIVISNGQPGGVTHLDWEIGLVSFYGTVIDGVAYFVTCLDTCSLVRSDGTVGGTAIVTTLDQFSFSWDHDAPPPPVVGAGDRAFITIQVDPTLQQLWVTDGTAAGTSRLNDPTIMMSAAALGTSDPWLWFVGGHPMIQNWRLWRTDGSAANTAPVTYFEDRHAPFVPFLEQTTFAAGSSWVFFSARVSTASGEVHSVMRCRIPD
jgi:ELWxxDGT repeat protein